MLHPLSSSTPARTFHLPLIIAGALALCLIGLALYLGTRVPAPDVTPYEKTIDAPR